METQFFSRYFWKYRAKAPKGCAPLDSQGFYDFWGPCPLFVQSTVTGTTDQQTTGRRTVCFVLHQQWVSVQLSGEGPGGYIQ